MKVAFYLADQNPHRDRTLGITSYTDGLLRELQKSSEVELSALTSSSSYSPPEGIATRRLPFQTDRSLARAAADNFHQLTGAADVDLWHYPKGHLPVLGRFAGPLVGTVHDTILQHYADHYPQARSRAAYAYWLMVLKRSIARFDLVLTVSEFSRQSIIAFCERHRIKTPPVVVTYEGFTARENLASKVQKENKVLHLASVELHKRTSTLLSFWKQLADSESDLPRLQLIGNLSPADRQLASTIPHVEMLGRVTSAVLQDAMVSAQALLLPSEIEGFGLPALEGYAAGTPAVYVRDTAVEELLGKDTPGGFLLTNFESFRAAVPAALNLLPEVVHQTGKRLCRQFSWRHAADITTVGYARAYGAAS